MEDVTNVQKKESIFARRMKSQRETNSRLDDLKSNAPSRNKFSFGESSVIVSGPEASDIHRENIAKIFAMSEKEIEEQKKYIIETLDPSSIEFLSNYKKKRAELVVTETKELGEKFAQSNIKNEDTVEVDPQLLNSGLHMDVVEKEKLEWTTPIQDLSSEVRSFQARFDFDGNLMPYVEENKSTCDKGLYHHGEEPGRPGYTISELYQLTRSSVLGQRVQSLKTLANILEKRHITCKYLETPLLKLLVESDLFLILRFSLDDPNPLVYSQALRSLAAILWDPLDMGFVRNMCGLFGDMREPCLYVKHTHSVEDEPEFTDHQLLKLDMIKCALRTDLLSRFKYIIQYPAIEAVDVHCILRCLQRIAYHSNSAAKSIFECPLLLDTLMKMCRQERFADTLYVSRLVATLRLIASHSHDLASKLVNKYELFAWIPDALSCPEIRSEASSQCMYLWATLLYYDILQPSTFCAHIPVIGTLTHSLKCVAEQRYSTQVMEYASAFLALFTRIIEKYWSNDFIKLIKIVEAFYCEWASHFKGWEEKKNIMYVKLVANAINLLSLTPINELDMSGCRHLTLTLMKEYNESSRNKSLGECSIALKSVDDRIYADNLPGLSVPEMNPNDFAPFVLTHALVKFSYNMKLNEGNLSEVKMLIFSDNLWSYLKRILIRKKFSKSVAFWFSRYEIAFIYDILRMARLILHTTEDSNRRLFLECAFALAPNIQRENHCFLRSLFLDCLFDFNCYSLREEVRKFPEDCLLSQNPSKLRQAGLIFVEKFNIPEKYSQKDPLIYPQATETVLPTDWLFYPILRVYYADNPGDCGVTSDDVNLTLEVIYTIEVCLPKVANYVTVTSRYVRMCCVLSIEDKYKIKFDAMLNAILRRLLEYGDDFNFNEDIDGTGKSTFYDFYTQFCELWSAVSYNDATFARYVMVPLQQKYDERYRIYFWTEQVENLRGIRLSADESYISEINFVEPCETNVHILQLYVLAIERGHLRNSCSPLMFRIATHHLGNYVKLHLNSQDPVMQKTAQSLLRRLNTWASQGVEAAEAIFTIINNSG